MKKFILQGTYTAIVTPFTKNGDVDFENFEKLVEYQIENGVEGIVVGGSTGENFALNHKEKTALLVKAVELGKGKIGIIAGTGTNETQSSSDYTLLAKELGADAALVVAPYYNKPSQEGLFEHYRIIAEQSGLPVIIYNIPGRSCVNISADTVIRLAEACPNIIGIKEASADLEQMMDIIRRAPEHFSLLSGDDYLTVPVTMLGGKGVISTISNYMPKQFGEMTRLALKGKYKEAMKIHYDLFDMMNVNFIETNPVPVKYIMSQMKLLKEIYRLPLLSLKEENKKIIKAEMKKAGLI